MLKASEEPPGSGESAADEPAIEVTQPMTMVDPATITARSPKRYIEAATEGGFIVRAGASETRERRDPVKTGPKAGEPRPDVIKKHLWVEARAAGARFHLHFVGNSFSDGAFWDVAGWPVELWGSYEPSALHLKRAKDEPEWAWKERTEKIKRDAEKRDHDYNDGEFWVNPLPRAVSSAMAFEEWLADLVPGFEPRKPPVRKPKQAEATASELIEIGEWTG